MKKIAAFAEFSFFACVLWWIETKWKFIKNLEIKEGDPKWEDGPRICFILPADAASYIIHSVITW